MSKESTIVRNCREYIKSLGGRSIKIEGSVKLEKEPDLIFCLKGRFFAWEGKVPNAGYRVPKKLWKDYSPEIVKWLKLGCDVAQADSLNEWEKAGGNVGVFRSVDELREAISHELGYEVAMRY